MTKSSLTIACFLAVFLSPGVCQSWHRSPITGVTLQLSTTAVDGQLHWKISNASKSSVFVYSFFLYGHAYGYEHKGGREVSDTTPTSLDNGTVNHFPPVLLLMVPAGDYREGDFRDPELKKLSGRPVSLKIGVGADPYSVVDEAKRLRQSEKATDNPFNAIFEWSTIIESNAVELPEVSRPGATTSAPAGTPHPESGRADPQKPQ